MDKASTLSLEKLLQCPPLSCRINLSPNACLKNYLWECTRRRRERRALKFPSWSWSRQLRITLYSPNSPPLWSWSGLVHSLSQRSPVFAMIQILAASPMANPHHNLYPGSLRSWSPWSWPWGQIAHTQRCIPSKSWSRQLHSFPVLRRKSPPIILNRNSYILEFQARSRSWQLHNHSLAGFLSVILIPATRLPSSFVPAASCNIVCRLSLYTQQCTMRSSSIYTRRPDCGECERTWGYWRGREPTVAGRRPRCLHSSLTRPPGLYMRVYVCTVCRGLVNKFKNLSSQQ